MSSTRPSVFVERAEGIAIEAHLGELAALRIAVFREFPYLYDGDLAYEQRYLAGYASSTQSVVILAWDGGRVVGAATAMPATAHSDEVAPALRAAGYDPERVFYFGESVLDPAYRGIGVGRRFLDEREAFAREQGYATAAFCAVARPVDHPRRPPTYRPLDELWRRQGFVRRPDIETTFSWRDLDEASESPKRMIFWTKELA